MPKANIKKASTSARKTSTKTTSRASSKQSNPKVSLQASKPSASERAKKVATKLGIYLHQPRYLIPAIIIIVAALLYIFRSAFIVAIVNGQPILRSDYNKQLEAQAGKQVMNTLVTEKLIEQDASKQHITVSQSELDTQVKSIESQLSKQGQTLDTALAAQGMTRSDFMTQLKLQTIVKKLLASKIAVSDQEVSDYIDKNKDSLPAGTDPSQLRAQVRQQLEQQKLSQEAQALVQRLQQEAKITYFTSNY